MRRNPIGLKKKKQAEHGCSACFASQEGISDHRKNRFDQRTDAGDDKHNCDKPVHSMFAQSFVNPVADIQSAERTEIADDSHLEDEQTENSGVQVQEQTDRVVDQENEAHLPAELIAVDIAGALDVGDKENADAVERGEKARRDGDKRHHHDIAFADRGLPAREHFDAADNDDNAETEFQDVGLTEFQTVYTGDEADHDACDHREALSCRECLAVFDRDI